MTTIWKVLTRKKKLDPISAHQSELGRVLTAFDLTALGIGSTLGVGVYVLAGHVAKDVAGPSVILSFLIAAIASIFAGLCYAEFGARAPRAGSAYIYSYVCVGEFVAFVIGWNLILEYVIGSASVARGLSLYLDTLLNDTLQKTFIDIAPIHVSFMSAYFDFFAFGVSMLLSLALAFGMKESSWANNIFTTLNLGVVLFVIIAGSTKADLKNWDLSPNSTNSSDPMGKGGFFPFGIEGMIKGAATCFYGFVGFDCIATTGEEVKNPQKAIPLAIILSLFVIFLSYFGTSTVITLMVPYYLQDADAPIPHAFEMVGWDVAKWVVAIGGIFGLCASLFGAMFPLPRIIYAMATDGVIFRFLGLVNSRFKTPVIGTLLAGLLTGLMAALFELKHLVSMMSIGTLLAYTIVAASVLLLRYELKMENIYEPVRTNSDSDENCEYNDDRSMLIANNDGQTINDERELIPEENASCGTIFRQIFNCNRHDNPTKVSQKIVSIHIFIYCTMCVFIGLCAIYLKEEISNCKTWAVILAFLPVLTAVFVIISILAQPKSNQALSFKVPLVPLIPALSILINIYLMLMLDSHTWIRFGVWMMIGLPTYFFSIRNCFDARNISISSRSSNYNNNITIHKTSNGTKSNGYVNYSFDPNEKGFIQNLDDTKSQLGNTKRGSNQTKIVLSESKRDLDEICESEFYNWKNRSKNPPNDNITSTIAILDEILDKEDSKLSESENPNFLDRKISADTESNLSMVLREENTIAVVHHDNIISNPPTPIPEISPLENFEEDSTSMKIEEIEEVNNEEEKENHEKVENLKEIPEISSQITNLVTAEEKNDAKGENNIPIPPPLINLDNTIFGTHIIPRPKFWQSTNHIPRPKISMQELSGVILKPPETPEVDYATSDMLDLGDNLKFGSHEHQKFLEKLNKKLQVRSPTPVIHSSLDKSINNSILAVPAEDFTNNDNVVAEKINRDDVKKKLEVFLQQTMSIMRKSDNIGDLSEDLSSNDASVSSINTIDKENNNSVIKSENDLRQHRNNMDDIFKSIRLRNKIQDD